MRDFTKRYTAEQIEKAKAEINDKFDTRALTGEDYDKLLDQMLQILNPVGRPMDIDDRPTFLSKPAGHAALEGEYLKGMTPEPLLTLDNVKAMPENHLQGFEDRVVQRLMLAMARGELKLELDGTPAGKARDMRTIRNYLDSDMEGLSQENPFGPIWFETPDNNGMSMSKFVPDEKNLLLSSPSFQQRHPELFHKDNGQVVFITPIKNKDE